jgi:hypothetical protein
MPAKSTSDQRTYSSMTKGDGMIEDSVAGRLGGREADC